MMEKVKLPEFRPRRSEAEIREQCPWATLGKPAGRKPNIITSLELDSAEMEKNNVRFQAKYRVVEEQEVRYRSEERRVGKECRSRRVPCDGREKASDEHI